MEEAFMDLSTLRNEIDRIDSQLVQLYEQRMEICSQVAEYKIENGKKVFDKTREEEKLARVRSLTHNDFNSQGVTELFEQIMAMSRKLQYQMLESHGRTSRLPFIPVENLDTKKARVVFQGAEGAYSQAAMMRFFGERIDSIHVDSFRDAMSAIEEGSAEFAVLPIENSTAGIVSEIYDLLVEFENYTRSQVQARLQSIFEAQYELKLEEKVEIRTRKETRVGYRYNPITGTGHTYTYQVTVQYEYKILNVTLLNRGVDYVARNSGLTDDQLQRYEVTLECRGNRDDLFAGIAFATPDGAGSSGEYQDYDIPGEALTDEKFRKMITEAEKYLGYPYVWGGSSPSTSFDCSGFVSWVINHCGNGWNVGRQTANGLMGKCDIIPKSEAKPGDLIFFQKTYNTSGASHVGIYVGNGMMIHCGSPISYASIETSYWRQHYYCMGRIR